MKNEKSSVVSIITPTFNSAEFVADNIRSVLGQTYKNIEHIIVDGGSGDGTLAIVKRLDLNAVVISEPDRGISDAFNKGLKLATGDIIAVLNSDDYYAHSKVVERIVAIMSSKKDVAMVYGKVRLMDSKNRELQSEFGRAYDVKGEFLFPHQAFFAKREVYDRVGGFSLKYRFAMDLDFFLRAVAKYEYFFCDEVFAVMRQGGAVDTNRYSSNTEVYSVLRSNGAGFFAAFGTLVKMYVATTAAVVLRFFGLGFVLRYIRQKRSL